VDLSYFDSRVNRPIISKLPDFQRGERLQHVIFADQFDRELLDHLCDIADYIHELSRSKDGHIFLQSLLPHKRAMLYFTQVSTRTFLSFMASSQLLGLTCNEIRDPSLSSEYKGESPLDSIRMFSSYFNIIFMRSIQPDLAECSAYLMNDLADFNDYVIPIVNGGSGADEHPTQALLDIYTIKRTFDFIGKNDSEKKNRFDDLRKLYPGLTKGLSNKSYCFVGDIGRGRTVRSLAKLLSLYPNVTMYFIAPESDRLSLSPSLRSILLDRGVNVIETSSIEDVISDIDILYMTRIQREHDKDGKGISPKEHQRYCLTPELVARMKAYAGIMHPFPRNEEIPFTIDADSRALYFHQARNGMWARAALIAHLFDVDRRVAAHYMRNYAHGNRHDYNKTATN
jgi:aspartate carbamoyltransferase